MNRIRWDPGKKRSHFSLTFVHRGAPGDVRTVAVSDIAEVHGSWFLLRDQTEGLVTIPFHRVLEVRDVGSGKMVWQKRVRGKRPA